ncbi:DUF7342 family protein [Natrarchaeobaculum aegyptiacum]|uniref:Transcriptional regulator n=1 Tax=Natrarchaeobaculum aegyptiacum TaxID=745377 RepID=A0A2Z2HT17_9EURY|nr:ArsR family transcriptional regulator [Natrarchaeobaculum aegyptiacum]ARS89913.1 hypothetical protein B1756_09355 [Natrarchaeobaculum aegyptiacum]
MDTPPDDWTDHTSGRERVRLVVDTLEEPATVNSIAERAAVAWETADKELSRLEAENTVRKREDGRYEVNPVRQFLDQIVRLIETHSRAELESQLQEYQEEVESLESEYDVASAQNLRELLTDDDVSADEIREIRNVSDTWGALELEIRLLKNALQLYDDLSQLSQSNGDTPITV